MLFNILLVEDSPTDAAILQASFAHFTDLVQIQVLTSGLEMLELMNDSSTSTSLPDLVLLDLHLPYTSGHELLRELRAHQIWGLVPIMLLSSSSAQSDITKSYDLHANDYMTKPKSLEGYQKVVQRIYNFLEQTIALPQTCNVGIS